jgi:hypothetical protein
MAAPDDEPPEEDELLAPLDEEPLELLELPEADEEEELLLELDDELELVELMPFGVLLDDPPPPQPPSMTVSKTTTSSGLYKGPQRFGPRGRLLNGPSRSWCDIRRPVDVVISYSAG